MRRGDYIFTSESVSEGHPDSYLAGVQVAVDVEPLADTDRAHAWAGAPTWRRAHSRSSGWVILRFTGSPATTTTVPPRRSIMAASSVTDGSSTSDGSAWAATVGPPGQHGWSW